jgi:hypothetical protein
MLKVMMDNADSPVCIRVHVCRLGMDGNAVAGLMCTAVFEGDLVKLRRLLRSGAPPNAADYDKRCALHIAGAEGSLAAVKLLVEEGGADPMFQVGRSPTPWGRLHVAVHFSSLDWIGLDWIGLDWIGLDWIGLDWIGLDWIGLMVPSSQHPPWAMHIYQAVAARHKPAL